MIISRCKFLPTMPPSSWGLPVFHMVRSRSFLQHRTSQQRLDPSQANRTAASQKERGFPCHKRSQETGNTTGVPLFSLYMSLVKKKSPQIIGPDNPTCKQFNKTQIQDRKIGTEKRKTSEKATCQCGRGEFYMSVW